MAWPYPLPPNTRTNASPQQDNHPNDHNAIATALAEILGNGTWVDITPTGGWAVVAGVQRPQYTSRIGLIFVRGYFGNGSIGTPVFTLPAAFRPITTVEFPMVINNAGSTFPGRMTISAAGVMTPNALTSGPSGAVSNVHAGMMVFANQAN